MAMRKLPSRAGTVRGKRVGRLIARRKELAAGELPDSDLDEDDLDGDDVAAKRARLEQLTAKIREHYGAISGAVFRLGTYLAEIRDRELYVAGGYEQFGDYLEANQFPARTAYRFIAIATSFDAKTVQAHSMRKLEMALSYSRAAGLDAVGKRLLDTKLALGTGGREQLKRRVSIRAASAEEIREAIRRLEVKPDFPPSVTYRVQELEAALPAAPKGLNRKQRVKLTRGQDGQIAISFASIPFRKVEAFLEAVEEHLVRRR